MLRYPIVSSLAVRFNLLGWKRISHSTDAYFLHPTSYVYDPTNTKTETKGEI